MRWIYAIALAAILACGSDKTTETDTNSSDTDTDTDADTDTIDTALAVMGYLGEAVVTLDVDTDTDNGSTYVGTETYYVTSVAQGNELCKYVYQVANNAGGSWPACADPMGNPCEFGFEVEFSGGAETAGDCDLFFGTLSTSFSDPAGYGYIEDYVFDGNSYGPSLMYYFQKYYTSTTTPSSTYYYGWGGVDVEADGGSVDWNPGTGEFSYDWVSDTISYFP